MLTVKASAKPSPIHGIGLFADAFIPKGTITWRFNSRFDILFDLDEVTRMSPQQREFIEHFAYLSKESGKYIFSIDDSRFTNHSSEPNISTGTLLSGDVETVGIADRDINAGEELTIDYRNTDAKDAMSDDAYLSSPRP